jgi:hypothetical protein
MHRGIGVAVVTLLILLDVSVIARAGKVGREFRVNSYAIDSQDSPSVASLSNGGFVVVWNSFGQDGSEYGVYGQRYDATGARVGGEFRVNRTLTGSQRNPSVTGLSDASFVVVWSDGDIRGQHFDVTGAYSGAQFRMWLGCACHRDKPTIIPFGPITPIWTEVTGPTARIIGQRLGVEGRANSSEFDIGATTSADGASAALIGTGGFVAVWASPGQDGSQLAIRGRRFSGGGNRDGPEFQVNTYTANSQAYPSVAGLNDGGFLVAWSSYGQDGSWSGIYAQRHDLLGNRVGGEFRVNVHTTDGQSRPKVGGLADGGYVIAWQSLGQDGSGSGIYAQRYTAAGARIGGNFQVNTMTAGHQAAPSVVGLAGGGFVVIWEGADGSGKGIYGQLFSP